MWFDTRLLLGTSQMSPRISLEGEAFLECERGAGGNEIGRREEEEEEEARDLLFSPSSCAYIRMAPPPPSPFDSQGGKYTSGIARMSHESNVRMYVPHEGQERFFILWEPGVVIRTGFLIRA